MNLLSNVGKGLIKWTPKIAKASSRDIAEFGPQAARVRALLNFIPGVSEDAAKISVAADSASRGEAVYSAMDAARNAGRGGVYGYTDPYGPFEKAADAARWASMDATGSAADIAAASEAVSDLITPEVYRTLTNPMASARALDRLAGRAPESFVPTARDMGERGLVSAPADIVTALRISKLPQQQQSLVMGLVDSGMTIEDALAAMRALS
jgi:hypothetical protein